MQKALRGREQLFPLFQQMPRKLGVDVVEKGGPRWRRRGFGDLERRVELCAQLVVQGATLGGGQRALRLERARQTRDRIARAPLTDFGFAAVERGVVTGRMRAHAI